MAAVVSRWKWRWSIEGNCPCINGACTNRGCANWACTRRANSCSARKTHNSGESGQMAPGSLIPLADTCSTRPSCASYFVVQDRFGAESPGFDVQLSGGKWILAPRVQMPGEPAVAVWLATGLQLMSIEESGGRA